MNRREFVGIAKSSLREWQSNNASLRSAALAFFIILPLPSILLITAEIYSQFFGQAQSIQQLIEQISALAGPTIGRLIGQLLQGATNPLNSIFNSVFSIVFAIVGVVGAFSVLQDTFNVLWAVKLPKHRSIKTRLQERFVSFDLVLGAAVIAVGLLTFTNSLINTLRGTFEVAIGAFAASVFLVLIQAILSFGSGILLFAIIFKEIPDTHVAWGDVWLGAVIAGIAFTILNNLFSFYLQNFPVTSLEVAAGSLLVLLLWLFIIAQILLYGAQFTKCFAETVGSHARQEKNHEHTWKRLKEKEGTDAETGPELLQSETEASRFGNNEKENGLNAKTKIEKIEPMDSENKKNRSAEPKRQQNPASETNDKEKLQNPNTQIVFSQTKSNDASEKDYSLNLKWKTKKKLQRQERES
jgi:membrane protein